MEEAIQKINDEMQKNPNDPYTEIIGHYLIDRAGSEPDAAGKILREGKSLPDAMAQVMLLAKKKQNRNTAVLTPDQVFGEIDSYFGFEPDPAAWYRSLGIKEAPRQQEPSFTVLEGDRPAKGRVDIDLDDFL